MKLEGTNTEKNLKLSFAGESQAAIKYLFYAAKARKDGYEQIANIFDETSHNELEHAKIWFKLLHNGMPSTSENLVDAYGGENYEWTDMYDEYARVARSEGFENIAKLFEGVARIESDHEQRFKKLLSNIEDSKVFIKPHEVMWQCLNCGHLHVGPQAPKVCPVCSHPQAYFRVLKEEY